MYRRALSQPARLIVLLGIWLILGPTFLWSLFAAVWPDERSLLYTIFTVFWTGLSGIILYRITKNYVVERMCFGKDGPEDVQGPTVTGVNR